MFRLEVKTWGAAAALIIAAPPITIHRCEEVPPQGRGMR